MFLAFICMLQIIYDLLGCSFKPVHSVDWTGVMTLQRAMVNPSRNDLYWIDSLWEHLNGFCLLCFKPADFSWRFVVFISHWFQNHVLQIIPGSNWENRLTRRCLEWLLILGNTLDHENFLYSLLLITYYSPIILTIIY